MKNLVVVLVSVMSLSIFAKTPDMKELEQQGLVIQQGTILEVRVYNPKSETYELGIVKEPGVGPNIATAENLSKATGVSKTKLKERSGSEITLKKPLILLSDEEVEKIKDEAQKQ